MKRSTTLFITIILFFSCKSTHRYNPEAIKLNDSVAEMQASEAGAELKARIGKDSFARIEIAMLDKATSIDSNYFLAYMTKFSIQYTSKQYSNALATGKELVRLAPKDATVKFLAGKIYDKTGDTVRARVYYRDYLNYCVGKLDTMSEYNRRRKEIELNKACVLILLNQPNQAHDILSKLYKEADTWNKGAYLLYLHLTKADLLAAKDTTITIGQTTTSINTLFP